MSSSNKNDNSGNNNIPVVVRDPRFQAGRKTIGTVNSVDVFATLLEEARRTYGDDHLETVPAYYEYGNALLRVSQRKQQNIDTTTSSSSSNLVQNKETARTAAAEAAERRAAAAVAAAAGKEDNQNNDKDKKKSITSVNDDKETENDSNGKDDGVKNKDNEQDDDDLQLALEMMETAWSILDKEYESTEMYKDWIQEQIPRILTGLGDILSVLNRHADSADAYLRALEHRQNILQSLIEDTSKSSSNNNNNIELLQCRRKVVEVYILIVEELLSCQHDQDVITTETKTVLVKGGDVIDYARGYYDKARDELQETVLLLGQLAAQRINVIEEKENICFAATMVMSAGETLAAIEEDNETSTTEPKKKKAKT